MDGGEGKAMKIIGADKMERFVARHADAARPLARWVAVAGEAQWTSHAELKRSFPSADYVGNSRYVFNIKWNSYKLVVVAVFFAGTLAVRFVGTHAEYDRIDASTV